MRFCSQLDRFLGGGNRASRLLLLAAMVVVSPSCAVGDFRGDGKFVDHGPFAAKDRYVLDLGPVDLGRTGKYAYRMGNLPTVDFAIGLEIVEAEPNQIAGKRPSHTANVRLVLETSNKETVVSEDGSLKSWKWTFSQGSVKSFLYRAGEEHWVSNKDGTTSPVPDGVKIDEGWGTFFRPRREMTYQLTLEVLEAQAEPRPTRLLLKGGGWK